MAINDPSVPLSDTRQIAWRLTANGAPIPGVEKAEVRVNSHRTAATWSAQIASSADPGRTMPYWHTPSTGAADILIDVQISVDGGDTFTTLITGRLDRLDWEPINGILRIDGRDPVADLVETKTFGSYKNQTASEIVSTIAVAHGFTANVTKTDTPVGRYYEIDHDRLSAGQFSRATNEWDLIVYLAEHEGYDVFFSVGQQTGKAAVTLNFLPSAAISDNPYLVRVDLSGSVARCNAIDVHLERHLVLARDIRVVVLSYHGKKNAGFKATAPTSSSSGSVRAGKTQQYVFEYPGISPDEAQRRANALYAELTQHERAFTFVIPGDTRLSPRNVVQLDGTGTDWDQRYFIAEIAHVMSFEEGYRMHVSCKNQSPASEGAQSVTLS